MAYTFKKLTDVPATTALGPTDQVLVVGTDGVKKVPSSEVGGGGKVEWFTIDKNNYSGDGFRFYKGKSTDIKSLPWVSDKGEIVKSIDEGKKIKVFLLYSGVNKGVVDALGYTPYSGSYKIVLPQIDW